MKLKDGKLHFQPTFLLKNEFLQDDTVATFILVDESNTELERLVGLKTEGDYYDIFENHSS